jgi:hypothetical protein
MELRGFLQPERFPQPTVAASDVTERSIRRKSLRIERVVCILRPWKRLFLFPRLDIGAIFWRQNLRAL